jgi:hypothetical protein
MRTARVELERRPSASPSIVSMDSRPSGVLQITERAGMSMSTETIHEAANREYKWGFVTDIDSDDIPPRTGRECHSAYLAQEG